MGRSVLYTILHDTVNLEIFAKILFSRNFAYTKFREIKSSVKWRNHCRLLIKENHALVAIFTSQICPITKVAKIKFSRKFPDLQ